MYETMVLDSRTIIVKSDNESELSEIMDFVSTRGRQDRILSFLKFASDNRKFVKDFKFNREECYGR